MKKDNTDLIWEAYASESRISPVNPDMRGLSDSDGRSHQPELNPEDWELHEIYTEDDWQGPASNEPSPYDQYFQKAQNELDDDEGYKFLVVLGPRKGTAVYEEWTDPSIILGVFLDVELNVNHYSTAIFVDEDGDGESFTYPTDVAESLTDAHYEALMNYARDNTPSYDDDPMGPNGVASFRDFFPDRDF